jgi:hypothetical protein
LVKLRFLRPILNKEDSGMQKQEFERRIGLEITSEEYTEIEAAYMGLPESVDKDKFVKIWLKANGIQSILNKRLAVAVRLREKISELEAEIGSLSSALRAGLEREDELRKENRALKTVIETIRGVVAEPDERNGLRVISEETNTAGVRVKLVMGEV